METPGSDQASVRLIEDTKKEEKYNTITWKLIDRQLMTKEQRSRHTSKWNDYVMDRKTDNNNHAEQSCDTDLTRRKHTQFDLLHLNLFYIMTAVSFWTGTKREDSITTSQDDKTTSQQSCSNNRYTLSNTVRKWCALRNLNRRQFYTNIYSKHDAHRYNYTCRRARQTRLTSTLADRIHS